MVLGWLENAVRFLLDEHFELFFVIGVSDLYITREELETILHWFLR